MREGSVVGGRFTLERRAGEGGMATVFRARDEATGLPVALKIASGADSARRLAREAKILGELTHPAIVRAVADGPLDDAGAYLALEWLDGEDLRARLERGPLSAAETLGLLRRAAEALATVHRLGLVHRDVTPGNVFLAGGAPSKSTLIDFGLARPAREDPAEDEPLSRATVTQVGAVVGTPQYMAPEQARGEPTSFTADVFSLGCVAFECLAGTPPFDGQHVMAVLAKILFEEAPRLADRCDVPAALDALVARMLAKDPAERPRDADEVLEAITAIQAGATTLPATPRTARALGEGEQRFFSVVLVAGAGAAIEPDTLRLAERFGARLASLADGSYVVVLEGFGVATDRAAAAAHCALTLCALAPGARIALATARATTRASGLAGEAIDRAARALQDHSLEAGAVAIDGATADLVGPRFEVRRQQGSIALLAERAAHDRGRLLLGKSTPMVGREREIERIESALDDAMFEPSAHVVLVTGPAGIGKSRLRYEFLKLPSVKPAEVWIGRADPLSAGAPFALLASALRTAFGLVDGEPPLEARAKVQQRVARGAPAEAVEPTTTLLGALVSAAPMGGQPHGDREDPTLRGDRMLEAFIGFVRAECEGKPLVLVLEDLQWGDVPTVRFVEAALRRLDDRPFFVLALARDEVDGRFPGLFRLAGATRLPLGPLSRNDRAKLVRQALGTVPSAVEQTIVERSEGNAFFLEELIRAAAESDRHALPDSVLAMVEGRIASLDAASRRAVRAASVFGQVFWRSGVEALLGPAGGGADGASLDDLTERELVERRPRSRFAGEEEFVFRNGLVRETAYAMLTSEDRALGHRIAGAWLEARGDRDASTLAEHYHRGGDAERSAAWLARAAEQALGGHDFPGALAYAGRALAAEPAAEARGRLELVRAEAHRWLGHFGEAEAAAKTATELLPDGTVLSFRAFDEVIVASGRRAAYDVASTWAARAERRAAYDVASTWAARAERIRPDSSALDAQVICLCSAARQLFHAGRYDEADRLRAHLSGIDFATLDPRARAEVHRLDGARARHVGDLALDLAGYEGALAAYELASDARNASNARVSYAFACIEAGDAKTAKEHLLRALDEAGRLNLASVATRARQNLALVLLSEGDLGQARALARQAIAESADAKNERFEAWTRVYLARILLRENDLDLAEKEARTAEEDLRKTPPARAGALSVLASILLARGDAGGAFAAAREAFATLEALGGIEEFESLVWLAFVQAARAAGHENEARAAVTRGLERLETRARAIGAADVRARFLAREEHVQLAELGKALKNG